MTTDQCKVGGCSKVGCEGGHYCFNADGTRKVVSEEKKQELRDALKAAPRETEQPKEHVPHTRAGFIGGYYALNRRKPTDQELWNAAVKSAIQRYALTPPDGTVGKPTAPIADAQTERGAFLAWWCEDVPENMREKWKENVDECLLTGNAQDKLVGAWDGFEFGLRYARAALQAAPAAENAAPAQSEDK